MAPYRAGIVGAGGIAGLGILGMHDEADIGEKKFTASHAGGYAATDDVELVAVADVDEDKLDRFGEAWEIPPERRYVGHEAMLDAEDLDAVSVCTPSFLHRDHVVDAARSAADPDVIWCEKPIAASVTGAEEMVDVCDETDAELLVNHSFRFTEKQERLRELVREGQILGDVHSVSMQFRMELLRNSTHLLDMLVSLLDARAERVSGYITGENEAVDTLAGDGESGEGDGAVPAVDDAGGGGFVVMGDGTFATVDCTVPRADSSMTMQFVGTEGKLYLNNDDGEWRYWRLEDGEHVEADLPGIDGSWTWDEDYQSAFPAGAQHISDILNNEADNHSSGIEATKSLAIITSFYLSHYTDGKTTFPLDDSLKTVSISSW